ncbi:transglycosylase domain-containing protein [Peribacillus deserti]|uniref:Peptidoglycan glycosyltransferase n=1 Tax=Peribacillus deserti TaxID=673318 RepID=A0A2N5MAY4_9BACI|nr:transglycosylase domain-containing protein [Peribacillus deserti]PLT31516.1 peptidoglycan glycosyltransferase [Peribacillus deserti]
MENNRNPFKDTFKKVTTFLEEERTKRSFSITYQVIWNLLLIFIITAVLGVSFAGGVGAGYFASLVKDEEVRSKEDLKQDIYNFNETSEIFFANNVYMGKMRSDLERETVTIDQIPEHLSNALIATEDEYFYKHDGVVPKAILRAIFQDMTNAPIQSGGSTLTQQIIKNQILTNEVSFDRKAKEILLALRLEKFFDKKEILAAYLNLSTFGRNSNGRNIAGVQSAAKGIFGKDVKNLNLPQAAFIAGLPQSPFGYTPYTQNGTIKKNLQPGLDRMKTVLSRMKREGFITEAEYTTASKYNIVKDFIGRRPQPQEKYPWLTYEVEQRSIEILAKFLAKQDGVSEKDYNKDSKILDKYETLADRNIRQKGYKIHTTIDKKMLDKMEAAKNNYPNFGPDKYISSKTSKTEPVEVGAMLIENSSGKILSFIGGRDYKREQTNHATNALRSNGSTMKPLLVYAPGLELGALSPGSIVADMPIKVPAGSGYYEPGNYGDTFHGITTARTALLNSYNVPAVKFYMDIQGRNPVNYLEKMGFSSLTEDDHHNISMALGALQYGVSVEENVNAYTTFANSGKFIDAYMIEKIEAVDGKVIYQHKKKPVNVFSPQTAYLTLDMMRDVVRKGTAASVNHRLKFSSDWAGKTGTGQDYHDAWFVASNPKVTFGTWMGYDTPKPLEKNWGGLTYSQRNLYLWADLINAAYDANSSKVSTSKRFEMPGGIVTRSSCEVTGLPSDICSRLNMTGSDIANAKFAASKVGGTFNQGRFVRVGGRSYTALPTTPQEFTEPGLMLSSEILQKIGSKYIVDPGGLLSGKSGSSSGSLSENGKTPGAVSISVSGSSIVWGPSPDSDVIGYRIYRGSSKVGIVKAGSALTFKADNGAYMVRAVDIAGNESSASNIVNIGGNTKTPAKEPEQTKPAAGTPAKQDAVSEPEDENEDEPDQAETDETEEE